MAEPLIGQCATCGRALGVCKGRHNPHPGGRGMSEAYHRLMDARNKANNARCPSCDHLRKNHLNGGCIVCATLRTACPMYRMKYKGEAR